MPLSPQARAWLDAQPDRAAALVALASGGDDYEDRRLRTVALPGFTVVGEASAGQGVEVHRRGRRSDAGPGGWRHG
jgi:thiamine-monophosphate kinase